ncbi:MAG: hypothetical protein JWQ44_2916 [Chthoniobacter sp.]|nr:hypothetical protein [Chthoniobacter sp.]
MAHNFSMLDLMNAALMTEGFEEIVAADDGSDEWRLLSRNWPLIVEAELEDGMYSFSRKEAVLLSRQPGLFGFADAYIVPANALHVRRVWVADGRGGRVSDFPWGQDNTRVFVDWADGVVIEYLEAADPSFWTANFSRGVQARLQAVLLNFREEKSAALEMDKQAEIYFQRARTKSSKSRSATEQYKESAYRRARFGRG